MLVLKTHLLELTLKGNMNATHTLPFLFLDTEKCQPYDQSAFIVL